MREFDDDDVQSSPYSRKVGDRLRVIRRQKRLSLQEVEANSDDEFKASVVGKCVVTSVARWRFPAFSGPTMPVDFPVRVKGN